MGFFITEEVKIASLGVSVANCYVTFKGNFSQSKGGSLTPMPMMMPVQQPDPDKPYVLSGRYYIYAAKDPLLQPLKEEWFSVSEEFSPNVPLAEALYNALKANKFEGLTCTDDL